MDTTESDKNTRILQLLEFYFGDVNLNQDKFMTRKIKESPEGYVDIAVLLTFNKLKSISTDVKDIVEAVEASQLLQLDETKTRLKRKVDFKKDFQREAKTVYVEYFPPNSDHDTLTALFSKAGKVVYVSLPRNTDKSLKGFGFIEFSTNEDAQKALQLNEYDFDKSPKSLRVISKTAWKVLREEYEKLLEQQQPVKKTLEYQHDVIVKIENVELTASPVTVKMKLKEVANVVYLDENTKAKTVYARCSSPEEVNKLVGAVDKLKEMFNPSIVVSKLSGDDETKYWARTEKVREKSFKVVESQQRSYDKKTQKKKLNVAKKGNAKRKHTFFEEKEVQEKEDQPAKVQKTEVDKDQQVEAAVKPKHIVFADDDE